MPDFTPTPQDIENLRQQCVRQAREALRLRDERDRLEEQESEGQSESGPNFRAAHAVYLLAAVAAIGIDILLLSPTAEFVVGRAFPSNPSVAFAAKLVLPVFVVLLELALAMRIYESRQATQDARNDVMGRAQRDYRFWWMLGAAFVCFVPILALSTQLSELAAKVAAPGEINSFTKASLLGKAIGISILAFVAHAMFVYGGRYIVESKELLVGYLFSTPQEAQLREATEAFEEQMGTVLDTFADYHQALRGYNDANPDQPIPAGPFPGEVRELINSGYGREILETPSDDPSGTGRSGNGRPAPSGRPAGDGASGNFSGGRPASDRDGSGNHRTGATNGDLGSEGSSPSRGGSGEDSGTGEDEENGSPDGLREQYNQSRRDDEDGRLSP